MQTFKQTFAALLVFAPFAAGAVPIDYDFDIVASEGSVSGSFTGDDLDMDGSLTETEILSFVATATGTAFTGGPFTIDAAEAIVQLFNFRIATLDLAGLRVTNGLGPFDGRESIVLFATGLTVYFGPRGSGRALRSVTVTPTTTSVPEPGSLALLGIGLAGIGLARRRRKD